MPMPKDLIKAKEWKDRIRIARLGTKASVEAKKNMRLSQLGRKHSKETRKKMSLTQRGKIVSEETKRKISLSRLGNKNPMYGKYREKNPNWKGGKSIDTRDGYVSICVFDNPFKKLNAITNRILEHRYVMEKHLNRRLNSDEVVHHIDGDKQNNKIDNLFLSTRKTHTKLYSVLVSDNRILKNKAENFKLCIEAMHQCALLMSKNADKKISDLLISIKQYLNKTTNRIQFSL